MTQDTDSTPPHGIPRPSPTALDRARFFVSDRLSDCDEWEERFGGEHDDRPELETLRDLLDIAEVLPVLWRAGEADALEGIADDLARMAGARPCSTCGELIADAHLMPTASVCYWCADDDGEERPSRCDGCNRDISTYQTTDRRYWLCLRCARLLRGGEGDPTPTPWERVKDAPAHPFGGAADR